MDEKITQLLDDIKFQLALADCIIAGYRPADEKLEHIIARLDRIDAFVDRFIKESSV